MTRVDGLTGQFREQQGGDKTRHLTAAMTTRKPPTNDLVDQTKMKTSRLGKSQVPEKSPPPAQEVKGEVAMFWEDEEEESEEE